MKIIRTTSDNPDFQELVKLLDSELWIRYPEEQSQYEPFNKIEKNQTVVIAYDSEKPAGCGCLKKIDKDTGEIKRMFVRPVHRGKGIGYAIMDDLEKWAKELCYAKVILETGPNQPEAIALYRKSGYHVTENYGPYIGMERSICMRKFLQSE